MSEPSQRHSDPFAHYDAAYLLGALSAEDRAAYEQHMASCEGCARAVRELAGVPGLLAHADPPPRTPEPPPPRMLPTLTSKTRRIRRRRTAAALASATVAVLACLALVLALLLPSGEEVDGAPMAALGDYPVEASVAVTATQQGSRIEMSCSYEGERGWDYVLMLIPRDGVATEIASWHALPGKRVHMSLATPVAVADIGALEVRTPKGLPVLRLDSIG